MPITDVEIVLAHGSYSTPALYEPLTTALRARGHTVHTPQLATSDLRKLNVGDVFAPDYTRSPPASGYPQPAEDIAILQAVLEDVVVERGREVLLLGHSAGGMSATGAATGRFRMRERAERGERGGVIGIYYIGAFVIPVGESVNSFFQPKEGPFYVPPFVKFHSPAPTGLATLLSPSTYLFNDLPPPLAAHYSSLLTASPILTTVLTNDAYAALPCAALVTQKDALLPPEYQRGMIAAQEQCTGRTWTVHEAPAGHAPWLGWGEGVVESVLGFVGGLVEGEGV